MSDSILECSGGHWLRAALTWISITARYRRVHAREQG